MLKLGKKRLPFLDQFLKYIVQSKNLLNLPFNLIIIYNIDNIDDKLKYRFKTYYEKYHAYTRIICITHNPQNITKNGNL